MSSCVHDSKSSAVFSEIQQKRLSFLHSSTMTRLTESGLPMVGVEQQWANDSRKLKVRCQLDQAEQEELEAVRLALARQSFDENDQRRYYESSSSDNADVPVAERSPPPNHIDTRKERLGVSATFVRNSAPLRKSRTTQVPRDMPNERTDAELLLACWST